MFGFFDDQTLAQLRADLGSPDDLSSQDRGKFYLDLADIYRGAHASDAAVAQLILQAQITTGGGIIGGAAVLGNAFAKTNSGTGADGKPLYNVTLDTFSWQIADRLLDAVQYDASHGGSGILTAAEMHALDFSVWHDKGIGDFFPGLVQMLDDPENGIPASSAVYQGGFLQAGDLDRNDAQKLNIAGMATVIFHHADEAGMHLSDFGFSNGLSGGAGAGQTSADGKYKLIWDAGNTVYLVETAKAVGAEAAGHITAVIDTAATLYDNAKLFGHWLAGPAVAADYLNQIYLGWTPGTYAILTGQAPVALISRDADGHVVSVDSAVLSPLSAADRDNILNGVGFLLGDDAVRSHPHYSGPGLDADVAHDVGGVLTGAQIEAGGDLLAFLQADGSTQYVAEVNHTGGITVTLEVQDRVGSGGLNFHDPVTGELIPVAGVAAYDATTGGWTLPGGISMQLTGGDLLITRDAGTVLQVDDFGNGSPYLHPWLGVTLTPPAVQTQPADYSGGAEFLVTGSSAGNRLGPSTAGLTRGNVAVTWIDDHGPPGSANIELQLFDAQGHKVGDQTQVNTYTGYFEGAPETVALPNGNFAVVWTEIYAFGTPDHPPANADGLDSGVKAQFYDKTGAKIGDEILVNTTTYSSQTNPKVAVLANGNVAIAWENQTSGVQAQVLDENGHRIGGEIQVRDPDYRAAALITDIVATGGGFAVSWSDVAQTGDTFRTTQMLKTYDSAGNAAGGAAAMDIDITNSVNAIVKLMPGADGSVMALYYAAAGRVAQRFDTDGARIGNPVMLDAGSTYQNPFLTYYLYPLKDGNYLDLAVGNKNGVNYNQDVLARIIGPDGTPLTDSFTVNTYTANTQFPADVTQLADGDVMITWLDASERFANGYAGVSRILSLKPPVAANHAPSGHATAVLAHGTQDHAYVVTAAQLLSGFSDADGDALSVTGLTADHGAVVDNHDGSFTVTPGLGFSGALSLSYSVGDGHGGTVAASETVSFDVFSHKQTGSSKTADHLIGSMGADSLNGAGDDTYYVDSLLDVVSETTDGVDDGGNDRVFSTVDVTLGAFVESLNLDGTGNINGIGNSLQNNIYGNEGNNFLSGLNGNDKLKGMGGDDTISGGKGNDILEGGTGADTFVFLAAASNGTDRIVDFEHGIDRLSFNHQDYDAHAAFTLGSQAVGAGGAVRVAAATETLWYDHDGAGGDAAIALATFGAGVTVTAADLYFT